MNDRQPFQPANAMWANAAMSTLLAKACPSIRYRLRREVLSQSPQDSEMKELQALILQDPTVERVLSWQQPDGWLGWGFHGIRGAETAIRFLCEKGVSSDHPVLLQALQALEEHPERLSEGIGKVGAVLDAEGLGGSRTIQATVLAYAGLEDRPGQKEQIRLALAAFRAVLDATSLEQAYQPYQGKFVFRPGQRWPSIYHLRLLAFTQSWRSPGNLEMVVAAAQRLVDWSPLPAIYLRHRSQIMAPASFAMLDFAAKPETLNDVGWLLWFVRMELLARAGVIPQVASLAEQVRTLEELLQSHGGWFPFRPHPVGFRQWSAYGGLMLERDWRSAARCAYDLTFRSWLILHYGRNPLLSTVSG
jgi:hypothetical protein